MSKFVSFAVSAMLLMFSFAVPTEAKTTDLKIEPRTALNAYTGIVEEHFAGILRTAKILALSDEAKSGKWESIKPLLAEFSKDLPTDATIWYAMPDGSYYTTESGTLTNQNLKDRAYFSQLLEGKDVTSAHVISKATGHRSEILATPVIVNGKFVAAIGISMGVNLLSDLVNAYLKLPENTYFYALDSDTVNILHKYTDRIFKTVSEVGEDPKLSPRFKEMMKKDQGAFDYKLKGKQITVIFKKSAKLGWYFFIAQEKK
jgi:hypothetical protein